MGKPILVYFLVLGLAVDARAIPESPPKRKVDRPPVEEAGRKDDRGGKRKPDAPVTIPPKEQEEIDRLRREGARLRLDAIAAATRLRDGKALHREHVERATKSELNPEKDVAVIEGTKVNLSGKIYVAIPSETIKADKAQKEQEKELAKKLAYAELHSKEFRFLASESLDRRALDGLSPADPLPPIEKAVPEFERNRQVLHLLIARDTLVPKAAFEDNDQAMGYGSKKVFFLYDSDSQLQKFFPSPPEAAGDYGIAYATGTWSMFYSKELGVEQAPMADAEALELARKTVEDLERREAPKKDRPAPMRSAGSDEAARWIPPLWRLWESAAHAEGPDDKKPTLTDGFPAAVSATLRIEFNGQRPKQFFSIPNRQVPRTFYERPDILRSVFLEAYVGAAFQYAPNRNFPGVIRDKTSALERRFQWWPLLGLAEAWAAAPPPESPFYVPGGVHWGAPGEFERAFDKPKFAQSRHFYEPARERVQHAHEISAKAAIDARAEFEELAKKYGEASKKSNEALKQADQKEQAAKEQAAKDQAAKDQAGRNQGTDKDGAQKKDPVLSGPGASGQSKSTPGDKQAKDPALTENKSANSSSKPSEAPKGDENKNADNGGGGKAGGGGGGQRGGGGEANAGQRAELGNVQPPEIPSQQPFPQLQFPQYPTEDNSILAKIAERLGTTAAQLPSLDLSLPPITGGSVFQGAAAPGVVTRAPAANPPPVRPAAVPEKPDGAAGNAIAGASNGNDSSGASVAGGTNGSGAVGKGGGGGDGGVLGGGFENGIGGGDDGQRGRTRTTMSEFVAYGAGADGGSASNGDAGAAAYGGPGTKPSGGPEAAIQLGNQLAGGLSGGRGAIGILAYVGELRTFTKGKLVRRIGASGTIPARASAPAREPAALPPPQAGTLGPADAVAQARSLVGLERL